MQRTRKYGRHRSPFDNVSGIHDGNLVGTFGNDAEVVRDQEQCHTKLGAQLGEQIEDHA
jgi:hypothetical protein